MGRCTWVRVHFNAFVELSIINRHANVARARLRNDQEAAAPSGVVGASDEALGFQLQELRTNLFLSEFAAAVCPMPNVGAGFEVDVDFDGRAIRVVNFTEVAVLVRGEDLATGSQCFAEDAFVAGKIGPRIVFQTELMPQRIALHLTVYGANAGLGTGVPRGILVTIEEHIVDHDSDLD